MNWQTFSYPTENCLIWLIILTLNWVIEFNFNLWSANIFKIVINAKNTYYYNNVKYVFYTNFLLVFVDVSYRYCIIR